MDNFYQYLPISLAIVFFASLAIQLFYYLFFYSRIAFHKQKKTENECEPLSVVICARNEAEHIRKYLPSILEQDYPDFEVIVVNDCSSDDTEMALAQLKLKYKNLRYTNITEDETFKHNKKLAVTVGIKSAKHECIVLTDADCYVGSNKWLHDVQQGFGWNKEIVLGYGGFTRRPGILNKLIRFDCMFIAMNYLGFAKAGIPYMGVGRNLAYKKTTFFKNKGFARHYEINSGDDDLLVNEIANKVNTSVVLTPDSIVRTPPKFTFSDYYMQKRRHLTTSDRYKPAHQVLLMLEPLSRFVFYVSALPAIYCAVFLNTTPLLWYLVGGVALRYVVQLVVVKMSMIKLKEKGLLLFTPIFELVLPLIHMTAMVANFAHYQKKRNKWR